MNKIINTKDELNIYLVSKGLKPASMITLNSPFRGYDNIQIRPEDVKPEEKQLTNEFREYLDSVGLSYKQEDEKDMFRIKGNNVIDLTMSVFFIGKDRNSLEKLVNARNDDERGLALGFPEKAVKAFDNVINGERINGTYQMVSLSKAKKAGIELPRWLAYISFIPEELDIVNGNISETSKRVGELYRFFVRYNNPFLAERIEQDFLNMRLPDSWKKLKNSGYQLEFKSPLQQ